jgi:hypothetical protein
MLQIVRGRGGRGGRGGWRIVIPMPEAINFVDNRRQKLTGHNSAICEATQIYQYETESFKHQDSNYVFRMLVD